jgi:hypothetical protein
VVIYPAANPPIVQRGGSVVADAGDLVLQPWEWTPVSGAAITDLSTVLQRGLLPALPTFSGWAQGAPFTNWSGRSQSMQPANQSFTYLGWPYPSSTSGSCT